MTRTTEHRDVVVVGGGQAGLAIGYFLARQSLDFTILEAAAQPAAAWRARWDSLRLFTPVRYDSLPGKPFPGEPDFYPGRDDVVAYLADYADEFDLPVELNSQVRAIRRTDHGYLVVLDGRVYEAAQVVIATGPFQMPRIPDIAGRLHESVVHFHSTDYRTPASLPPGPVLVVGGGNTGFQIAEELAASHEVHLSIGSRQTPLPQRVFGRDLFTLLDKTGLMARTVDSRLGRKLKQRETLIGSRPRTLSRKHGVPLHARATTASDSKVTFEDGRSLQVSSVIWATGYRLDHSFVDAPVFDSGGQVVHQRGVTASPGLYFLGLPWLYTRGSALLGWVKHDADYLAQRIGVHTAAAPSRPESPASNRIGEPA